MLPSAHTDTFTRDNLPPQSQWPVIDLTGFDYPERLNAAVELTDRMVEKGFGDNVALIGNGRQRTYKELADWSSRIAHALAEDYGVKPGNRVLIRSANNPAMVAAWLGATKAGAVFNEGDVILHNSPYYGASHEPDIGFCVPIFLRGELVGFSVTTAHHLDVGAMTPGSCGIVDAVDAYAEGLQFKALKVYDRGVKNDVVWRLLRDNIRAIPVDDTLAMQTGELATSIERDRAAGHTPVVVAASAGTAGTGAIDRLQEARDVCRRHDVWLHVDASYGGPAILTDRYERALAPLCDADSVALDPHKWLYVPVDAGVALVRDGAAMREAFRTITWSPESRLGW